MRPLFVISAGLKTVQPENRVNVHEVRLSLVHLTAQIDNLARNIGTLFTQAGD